MYASREVTLAQLRAKRLFTFQRQRKLFTLVLDYIQDPHYMVKAKEIMNKANTQVRVCFD